MKAKFFMKRILGSSQTKSFGRGRRTEIQVKRRTPETELLAIRLPDYGKEEGSKTKLPIQKRRLVCDGGAKEERKKGSD